MCYYVFAMFFYNGLLNLKDSHSMYIQCMFVQALETDIETINTFASDIGAPIFLLKHNFVNTQKRKDCCVVSTLICKFAKRHVIYILYQKKK